MTSGERFAFDHKRMRIESWKKALKLGVLEKLTAF